jgi:3-oxoadipate enol-lactonase
VTPIRVHRELAGSNDGPALVLADSLGCTLAMWDPQVAALTRRFQVIRYDLRGHGGSPAPPGPYTIAELGGDLIALLDDLGIARAHICGLSLGGMIAMWVAAHAPERVDRLVICASSAQLGPPEAWAARATTVLGDGMGAVADVVVGRWFTPGFAARSPDDVDRMRVMLESNAPVGYAGCCQAIETMDLTGDLVSIVAPTLVLVGADDQATPVAHSERLAAGIRDSRLAVVPDAAHLVNIEQPEAVNLLILEHLEGARRREEPT